MTTQNTDSTDYTDVDGVPDDVERAQLLRRRRAAAAAPPPPGAPEVSGRADDVQPISGPKLSKSQRATVSAVIAQYHEVRTVLAVLAEEYPEIPALTDDSIRYHRRRLNNDVAQATRQQAIQTGMANKAVRVAQLTRHYEELARVPLVDTAWDFDTNGNMVVRYTVREALARERRDTLKQIAQEMGEFYASTPGAVGGGGLPGTPGATLNDADLTMARQDLDALLRATRERDDAMDLAAIASVPPVELT